MARAIMVAGPPAANGITKLMGRVGYACADAIFDMAGSAAAPAASFKIRRRGCCVTDRRSLPRYRRRGISLLQTDAFMWCSPEALRCVPLRTWAARQTNELILNACPPTARWLHVEDFGTSRWQLRISLPQEQYGAKGGERPDLRRADSAPIRSPRRREQAASPAPRC